MLQSLIISLLFLMIGCVGFILFIASFYVETLDGKLGFRDLIEFAVVAGLSLSTVIFWSITVFLRAKLYTVFLRAKLYSEEVIARQQSKQETEP